VHDSAAGQRGTVIDRRGRIAAAVDSMEMVLDSLGRTVVDPMGSVEAVESKEAIPGRLVDMVLGILEVGSSLEVAEEENFLDTVEGSSLDNSQDMALGPGLLSVPRETQQDLRFLYQDLRPSHSKMN
jgi:hypothetical protein